MSTVDIDTSRSYSFSDYLTNPISNSRPRSLERLYGQYSRHEPLDNNKMYNYTMSSDTSINEVKAYNTNILSSNDTTTLRLGPIVSQHRGLPGTIGGLSRFGNDRNDNTLSTYMFDTNAVNVKAPLSAAEGRNIAPRRHVLNEDVHSILSSVNTRHEPVPNGNVRFDDIPSVQRIIPNTTPVQAQALSNKDRTLGAVTALQHSKTFMEDPQLTRNENLDSEKLFSYFLPYTLVNDDHLSTAKNIANTERYGFPTTMQKKTDTMSDVSESTRKHGVDDQQMLDYVLTTGEQTRQNTDVASMTRIVGSHQLSTVFKESRNRRHENTATTTSQWSDYAFKTSTFDSDKRQVVGDRTISSWTKESSRRSVNDTKDVTDNVIYTKGHRKEAMTIPDTFSIGINTTSSRPSNIDKK